MIELFAGVAGGLGLFIVGMWLLTENLKALASRRLRRNVTRWTANRFSAVLWGTGAGAITQSMSAMTFIVVSILRSGMISTPGALSLLLGGTIGVSTLVVIVTLDIRLVAHYVLAIAAVLLVSEHFFRYRHVAASFLGGAMIILGLVLLKEAAAPLAEEPWFRAMLQGTGESLLLAFVAAALLTAVVQSSSAVSIFGISLATVDLISVDQAIMTLYGSILGSGFIIHLLSSGLRGRSRQVAMYMVALNVLVCVVLVPLLYCELYFDIPLVKALVFSVDVNLDQQLALICVFLAVFPVPVMLAGLGWSVRMLERAWPATQLDELSQPEFIHDQAFVDVDSALVLADLEQKRAVANLARYFDAVRQDKPVPPLRRASQHLICDITEFLDDLQESRPMHSVEDRNSMRHRQKLLTSLEDAVGTLCETLNDPGDGPALRQLRTDILESVESVLLVLADAIGTEDETLRAMATKLTGDRVAIMRRIRAQYLERSPPLPKSEMVSVLQITHVVEETFSLLSKFETEFNLGSSATLDADSG